MEPVYQVGVAGCGMISEVYIRNLQTLFSDRLAVRGVFDRHPDRAQGRAAQFALPRVYETLEQMLSDPEIDIVLEQDGVLNPIEIKKTSNPGTELTKVFSLLDKASVPRGKGAIVCMKPKVGVIDRDNYIVPIWTI